MIKKNMLVRVRKIIKITIYIVLFLFLSCAAFMFYTLYKDNLRAEKNAYNIQFVKVGMSQNDVIAVMGEPDWISTTPEIQYAYTVNPDEYKHVYMTFDKLSRVKDIKKNYDLAHDKY